MNRLEDQRTLEPSRFAVEYDESEQDGTNNNDRTAHEFASPALTSPNGLVTAAPEIPAFRRSHIARHAWRAIDAADRTRIAMLDPRSRAMYLRLGYVPFAARFSLGHFQIDEHHTVAFDAVPALGEVSYSEVWEYEPGRARPPVAESDQTASPLLRFLQVTDKSVPVPLMMASFDDRSDESDAVHALKEREVVDDLDNYGMKLAIQPPTVSASGEPAAVATCFNGGSDVFSATYCEDKGDWHCDNDAWVDLTRSSGNSKKYTSHSRVAGCGGIWTTIEHQFRYWDWDDAKWRWSAVLYPIPPDAWYQQVGGGGVKYWKHVGGTKRRRKIHCWTDAPGYFRAWTAFY